MTAISGIGPPRPPFVPDLAQNHALPSLGTPAVPLYTARCGGVTVYVWTLTGKAAVVSYYSYSERWTVERAALYCPRTLEGREVSVHV